jgi:hypothetical protein
VTRLLYALPLFVLLLAASPAIAQTAARDDSGAVWPCQFIGSSGAPTKCGAGPGQQMPMAAGPPTQSATDPAGFGKAIFFGTGPSGANRALGQINTGCSPIACPSGERGYGAGVMLDENNVVVVGGDGAFGQLHIYRSVDAGTNYFASADLTNTNGVTVTPGDCNGLTQVASNRYALICTGSIFFTSDFNSVTLASPQPTNGIAGSSRTQGATWIVLTANPGGWCRASTSATGFSGCTTFTSPASTVPSNGQYLASPTLNTWIAVASNAGATVVFRSTDDGLTFTNTGAALANFGTSGELWIECISSTVCLIAMDTATGSNIYRSSDAGQTWALVYTTTAFHNLAGIANYGNGTVAAFTNPPISGNPGNPAGLRSQDFGQTWAPIAPFTQTPQNTSGGGGQTNAAGFRSVLVSPSGGNTIAFFQASYGTGLGKSIAPYYSRAVGAGSTIIAGENGNRLAVTTRGTIGADQGIAGPSSSSWPTAPVQGTTLANSRATGAANTAVTATLAATTGIRGHVYTLEAFCSAGSATLQVQDGATVIWATNGAEVLSTALTRFVKTFNPGLTGTTGNAMTITLGTCGVGNAGTLTVQADQS